MTSKCSPEKLAKTNKDEYVLDVIPTVSENEGGLWNMQLFRSITSDSCMFDDSCVENQDCAMRLRLRHAVVSYKMQETTVHRESTWAIFQHIRL